MSPVRRTANLAALSAASFLFLLCVQLPAQEVVFGGEAGFAAGVRGDASVPETISPLARITLAPDLAVFADTAEFRANGEIRFLSQAPGQPGTTGSTRAEPLEAKLNTLSLRLYPADWLTLDTGLMRHTSGAALLLSPVNYLAAIDADPGTSGDLPSTAGPAPLLGATAFAGSGYLSAFAAPAPAGFRSLSSALSQLALLDATGPFALELDDTDVSTETLQLASLEIGEPESGIPPLSRFSIEISGGLPLGPLDVTTLYYHGLDRVPTLSATADTDGPATGEYDLSLALAESVIDAVGLSAQTALGPAMLWLDGSYVFARTFGTTDFVPSEGTVAGTPGIYENTTVTAGHAELVAGGLVQFERPRLTLAGEYRHGFIASDRSDIIRLDFPGTALLSVTAEWLESLVTTTLSAIVLIPDASAVVVGSVNVSPSSELNAWLQLPVVVATESSLLRAARSALSVTVGLSYRF